MKMQHAVLEDPEALGKRFCNLSQTAPSTPIGIQHLHLPDVNALQLSAKVL